MINNVVLVGRLTRDVDLRYTSNGTAVGNFSLAVDRNFTNAQGERETDFINCVIWRRSAETLANYSRKGSLIGVTGRIQTRSYENNQGQTVYVTEVVADNFQLLEPKSVTEQRAREQGTANTFNQNSYSSNQSDSYQNSGYQQDNNSGQSASNTNDFPSFDFDSGNDPLGGSASPIDISDDDLPF